MSETHDVMEPSKSGFSLLPRTKLHYEREHKVRVSKAGPTDNRLGGGGAGREKEHLRKSWEHRGYSGIYVLAGFWWKVSHYII